MDSDNIIVSDFVLVAIKSELKGKHKSFAKTKHFEGQVVDYIEPCDEYIVKFLKREEGSKFSWPLQEDVALTLKCDIKRKLPQPTVDRRECLIFPVSFDSFVMG